MASEIEKALYGNGGTHGVVEFHLMPSVIVLRVAPWEPLKDSADVVLATFQNVRVIAVAAQADPSDVDDLQMPWDIIAFDSDRQLNGRWKFVLHCAAVEWCFESDWPLIEHQMSAHESSLTDDPAWVESTRRKVDAAVNSLANNGGQDGATVVNRLLDRFSAKRGKVE
jgi:hypothetical protein